MSQHDLTIANQGFPAFRADLNDALQALGSCQSGASAPSPTFANQLWYDTTNNILKIRNEDNDAWISLLTLNQTTDSLDSVFGLVIGTNVLAYDANLQAFVTAFTLPTSDGTNGQVLKTNGSGTLSFATVGGDQISAGNSLIQVVDTGTGYALVNLDGAEVARFTTTGLGIGTSSPAGLLDASGSGNVITQLKGTGSIRHQLVGGGQQWSESINYHTTNKLTFRNDTTAAVVMNLDTNGNLEFNSGYGSAATAYGCRAWVNFNGTGTVAIRASGNVSSITDNATGLWTVNMTNAMPDANYSVVLVGQATAGNDDGIAYIANETGANTLTTTSFPIRTGVENVYGTKDLPTLCASVFR